jgi:integrase
MTTQSRYFHLLQWAICLLATVQFIRYYVVSTTCYLNMPRYLAGQERLPFQYRILPIFLMWPFDHSSFLLRHFSHPALGWDAASASAPQTFSFYLVSLLSFSIAGLLVVLLYCAVHPDGVLAWLVYPIFLILVLWTYVVHIDANFSYPYDMPSLAFFAGGLLAIYTRRFLPLALVIFFGTMNRETTLFLIGIYILDAATCESQFHAHELELKFNTLLPAFGKRAAETITRQELVAWLDQQEKRRTWRPATYNNWRAGISLVFRVGITNEKTERNPMVGIRRKQANNGRCRYLSLDEEKRLVAALENSWPEYLPIFILSIHSCMRKSEERRSVVGDSNPHTKMLTVHQTKDRNAPAVRYVPMTPIAIQAYETLAVGKKVGDSLITNRHGDALSDTRRWFDPMLKEAGIEDYLWHDNRHTACSRWVMTGVPLAAVAQHARHKTIAMTMRYSHLIPDLNTQASEKMMSIYDEPVVKLRSKAVTSEIRVPRATNGGVPGSGSRRRVRRGMGADRR